MGTVKSWPLFGLVTLGASGQSITILPATKEFKHIVLNFRINQCLTDRLFS